MTLPRQLSLYVHWPWCEAKCPYCDFNSHAISPATIDQALWRDAYNRTLPAWRQQTGPAAISTVFFGGGTPSLADPQTIGFILEKIHNLWGLENSAEVTLEANPGSVEAQTLAAFRDAGVTRLSLGIQSLDDQQLAFLGRVHTATEARNALELGRKLFDNLSFDLIYALPHQTPQAWANHLDQALEFAPDHLSVYQLTVEPGTEFARRKLEVLNEEVCLELWHLTNSTLKKADFLAYEISNHSRPNRSCQHNLAIWRGGDYLGIGPGAHGRLTTAEGVLATHEAPRPEGWLTLVQKSHRGLVQERLLSPQERAEELLLLGLRLDEGINATRFADACGLSLDACLDPEGLTHLCQQGALLYDGQTLRVAPHWRHILNHLMGKLL